MFLKGDRCYSDKCAFERRSYAPGQHGQGRGKRSEYGIQLREKQKVKWMYGLLGISIPGNLCPGRAFERDYRNQPFGSFGEKAG